ncbi:hypothetical protein DV451_002071 [Geotrichum candidum]|uniref:Mitochondrial import inner membrane translocase subunit n=1 Tax=Geotrichum candidum TaxID=1173061 RepID=A0A9P5G824_GEOCN|nr:hypothetical protein DV451_002071 [Geotrichum candidum]KAI9212401.1 hypothetical protein DS838_002732 [Geotrichum bryndzae]KAF5104385.1 hypothetical protein DV453_005161 [Geotrichum candidum]KAF5106261.1 hypothetical protein DV452_005097 [Geotrichum candidum]KAF5107393.1 hypothetical protein DV454_005219 [Geotrichum candidum]
MSGFTSIFGSSSSANADASAAAPAPAVNLNSAQIKKQIQDQIAQELAVANATELVNCTKQCMEKYMHAWNTVSRSYISRIQQASAEGL